MPELWDIVDEYGRPTGRTHEKGLPMQPGEYHPAVSVWIVNGRGEFLISRRAGQKKTASLLWETTGCSVLAGESTLHAALRETQEELGLTLDPDCGELFCRYTWPHSDGSGAAYFEVWLFRCEFDLRAVVLQREETIDAMAASADDLRRLIREGAFIPYTYLEDLARHVQGGGQ